MLSDLWETTRCLCKSRHAISWAFFKIMFSHSQESYQWVLQASMQKPTVQAKMSVSWKSAWLCLSMPLINCCSAQNKGLTLCTGLAMLADWSGMSLDDAYIFYHFHMLDFNIWIYFSILFSLSLGKLCTWFSIAKNSVNNSLPPRTY